MPVKRKSTTKSVTQGPQRQKRARTSPPRGSATSTDQRVPTDDSLHDINPDELQDIIGFLPQLRGLEDRLQHLDASIQDAHQEVTKTVDARFSQIMDRLDQVTDGPGPRASGHGRHSGTPIPSPHNVLSRFSWIDQTTLSAIGDGTFDLNFLPKLHKDEDLRNRHSKRTADGYYLPMDGSAPHLVTARTKMQSAFRDLPTFLSAWLIYTAIRITFHPERGPGLVMWTDRIRGYALAHPWPLVLKYIIAYYGDYQNAPPEQWFSGDPELVTEHFCSSQPKTTPLTSYTNTRLTTKKPDLTPISEQVCQNWNRPITGCTIEKILGKKCLRRHVCSQCERDGHKADECPSPQSNK